jgi:hypothetical protein
MKGLLFLGLVGAAIYALLVYTHHVLPEGEAEDTFAGQTQPNQPVAQHLSSWGSHLASRSSQNPQAPLAVSQESAPLQQNAADEPRATDPSQNSERKPGVSYPLAASKAKAPASGSDGGAPVKWARVVLAAPMHDQASVSSPTIRFYSPIDLQVVRREGGWPQLSDPVTEERGWVIEKYLSSIDGLSSTQAARESTTEAVPAKAASSKPKKWSRSAKRSKPAVRVSNTRAAKRAFRANDIARWDPRSVRWARRADRRREFQVFMLGPPFAGR